MLDGEDLDDGVAARERPADEGAGEAEQVEDHGSTPVRMVRASRAARMPTWSAQRESNIAAAAAS